MRLASLQLGVIDGNKNANLDHAAEKVRGLQGCDLIILPELWNIGFMSFDDYITEAETKIGPTLNLMKDLARVTNSYLHTGSFVEKVENNFYNSSYLISPEGEELANYRKVHLFGFKSRETELLTAGEQVVVAETPFGNVGMDKLIFVVSDLRTL